MASLNRCQFIGNLGDAPEVRSTNSGSQVVNLRLACTEKWKDKGGQRQERTEWIRVTIFNEGLGKIAAQYLRKGSKVYISGKLQTRKWQAQDGTDRYSTEVVLQPFDGELILLDSKGGGGSADSGYQASHPGDAADLDDDCPF
jgi:single-strand DNA-binding protein